ncbi:MAG: ABC transporter ATP-binding protein [Deltaproteobacteria bacterium]|nr:ABC transporter ATP-binding protein [Deltaproteobacteria bacterium]
MLKVVSIHTFYGKIQALKGVSLHVRPGEIVTLIGANGAGKTTTLHTISGLITPAQGEIWFQDRQITGWSPERIVRAGVSQVPEGRQIFGPLSVHDNLILGAYPRYGREPKEDIRADMEMVFALFPILEKRKGQLAGTLSGGEQQMLAIGRALMSRPKLLLLDEPSMGLAPLIVRDLFEVIRKLRERGTTILLVEQNARAALSVADRGYVLETGRVIFQGKKENLLENQDVKRAYLGRDYREIWER